MAESGGQDKDQEKTEEATQTRREEFRKKGQVAQTKELGTAFFLLASAGGIYVFSQFFLKEFVELFQYSFGADMVQAIKNGNLFEGLLLAGEKYLFLLAPVMGITLILGVAGTVLQTGFLQVEDAFKPKFEKINPISGFGRIFSIRNFGEFVKSFLKIILIIYLAYAVLKGEMDKIPQYIQAPIETSLSYLGALAIKLFTTIGFTILGIALLDYIFQRWELEKQMMMTVQEVKEENKQREGDPLIKARIRRIQREVAQRRMMDKVPKADVIITNPTHIAVALKYDDNLPAPQVIAKGADLIAEKIKSIAREHNVPVVENKPLARTIFKTLKIGQVIPKDLFVAVAEVLAYVYKLKRRKVRK